MVIIVNTVAKQCFRDDQAEWQRLVYKLGEISRFEEIIEVLPMPKDYIILRNDTRRGSLTGTISSMGSTDLSMDPISDVKKRPPSVLSQKNATLSVIMESKVKKECVLDHSVYELILLDYLHSNTEKFSDLITKWPMVYQSDTIINAVLGQIQAEGNTIELLKSLSILYKNTNQYEKSVYFGMLCNENNLFEIIESKNMIGLVHDNLLLFLNYTRKQFTSLEKFVDSKQLLYLSTNLDHILPSYAIEILKKDEELLFSYEKVITTKDINQIPNEHNALIKLYLKYQPNELLNFLRLSSHYSYPFAYKLCSNLDLISEMLYLLGKMGDNSKALKLIIERLKDVEMAIDFAKEQNDDELWEEFLEYSMDKPDFIVGLLQNLASFIDPRRVIERIPDGLEIPHLKNAIIKTMSDCSVQVFKTN
jgi:hypothetical protein